MEPNIVQDMNKECAKFVTHLKFMAYTALPIFLRDQARYPDLKDDVNMMHPQKMISDIITLIISFEELKSLLEKQ